MKEASYYRPHAAGVVCELCPKGCVIAEGRTGACRARRNTGGRLYAENYAACSSSAMDPIEKKPLYHFYPGSTILSVGTWGCNFGCRFCQNWQIAQGSPSTVELPPPRLAELAAAQGSRCIGVAYTYSEPSVWFEYIRDTAPLVKARGLNNVLVTNGFIAQEPLAELLPLIDAMNIDVKAFQDAFYREICSGMLEPVKHTVAAAVGRCHVEVTTLVIPGLNDHEEEIEALAYWLSGLDKDIPLHLSRYFPQYRMDRPATPPATLYRAREWALRHLRYVYVGNVPGEEGHNTICPSCQTTVIDRCRGQARLTEQHRCAQCGQEIAIIGEVHMEKTG